MNIILSNIFRWIGDDYRTYPLRFLVELLAWAISIGCAIAMAMTAPTPPLIPMYYFWISGCILYGWAAWSRRSFGMIANYAILVLIDTVGLIRMLSV